MKKERGITLIALVITIIVLLILAGVSIAMLTGNNGILTQAQNASEQTEVGAEKEAISLAYIGATANKEGNGAVTDTDMDDQFGLNGTKADAEGTSPIIVTFDESNRQYMIDENGNITGPYEQQEIVQPSGTDGILTQEDMKNGVIEIKWLTGTTDYASDKPNAPVIKTDLPEGTTMKLVHYDASGNPVDGTDYNYDENKWANAEVDINGVKSYFVWIPRYAYKIIYFKDSTSKNEYLNGKITEEQAKKEEKIVGYSDSRGIVDKDGQKVDGVESTATTNVGDYFRVHPAFTNDSENNYENGGWKEELLGIWVGKYESSLVNKENSSNIVTDDGTTGNILLSDTKHNGKAIAVQPGMSSWRYCTIGNMYTNAKAYSTDLNSHMLKNSEWGAVAYLTESKYGRNGEEVTINDNSSHITADAGISENPEQSSTGNETGIYDLSGGAYEYVPAYYNGSGSLSNGSSFANGTSDEFSTAYTETSASSAYKPGDATYETSGWHGDDAYFVFSSYPFFIRGGDYSNGSGAGVFRFGSSNGNAYNYDSFRMCLAVK